jgi:hypothetical protein
MEEERKWGRKNDAGRKGRGGGRKMKRKEVEEEEIQEGKNGSRHKCAGRKDGEGGGKM